MKTINHKNPLSIKTLIQLADEQFAGELVKAVVDIEKELMVIGGAMHADEEALMIEDGSLQNSLWGINLRPGDSELIEFDSMINIRPHQNNRSRGVEDEKIQRKITEVVGKLVVND